MRAEFEFHSKIEVARVGIRSGYKAPVVFQVLK